MSRKILASAVLLFLMAMPAAAVSAVFAGASMIWTDCGANIWAVTGTHVVTVSLLDPADFGGTLNLDGSIFKCPFSLEVVASSSSGLVSEVRILRLSTHAPSVYCKHNVRAWSRGRVLVAGVPAATNEMSTGCESGTCSGSA